MELATAQISEIAMVEANYYWQGNCGVGSSVEYAMFYGNFLAFWPRRSVFFLSLKYFVP